MEPTVQAPVFDRSEVVARICPELGAQIFEHSQEAILVLDPARESILEVNPQACRLLGYERDELLGLGAPAIHPHDIELFRRFARRVLQDGCSSTDALSCRTKNGTLVPAEVFGARISAHGQPAILKLVRSITERRRIENALSESEERLQRILGSTLDAILIWDYESRNIQLFNNAAERLFGCTAAEALGRPVDRFLTPPLQQLAFADASERADDRSWLPEGFRARRADGSEVAVQTSVSRVEVRGRCYGTLILRDVENLRRAQRETLVLRAELERERRFAEIVGRSERMLDVLREVEIVAPTDSTVLILGETGTGKEMVARAIHQLSPLAQAPLITVNCAALPATLIESELFGHERGSFTGAHARKLGRFELADGGTLFLDEVGDLPLELQAKLLRVLQTGELERVGGTQTLRVRARVIAATNRDLEAAVESGSFRADLYYRLAVYPIELPPLRERPEDIPLLVRHFALKHGARLGKRVAAIGDAVLSQLAEYPWPGNVRELENIVERGVIVSTGNGELRLEPPSPIGYRTPANGASNGIFPTLDEVQRRHIRTALERCDGQVSGEAGAASLLGMRPTTLESRMKRLGIRHRGRRGRPPRL